MPEIDISFDGRIYTVSVEDGLEGRVHEHVRTLERYAEQLKDRHGRIERSLLVLLASIQALDDASGGSQDEALAAMDESMATLREVAGRVAQLAERVDR